MGVIKRFPRLPADPFASDNEALNEVIAGLQEDNQSNAGDAAPLTLSLAHFNRSRAARLRLSRARVPAVPVDTAVAPKRVAHGAKKNRRYENQLMLLREGDENEFDEVSIEDLVPVIQSARTFTRVLCETSMMELWNTFIDCTEESESRNQRMNPNGIKTTMCSATTGNIDPVDAFHGICRKLRNMLKQRHTPLGIMDNLEDELLDFFQTQPVDSTYQCGPLDAYRRGLLHAISQYNKLESHSVGKKKTEKVVFVKNKGTEFRPPSVRLVTFMENRIHAETGKNN